MTQPGPQAAGAPQPSSPRQEAGKLPPQANEQLSIPEPKESAVEDSGQRSVARDEQLRVRSKRVSDLKHLLLNDVPTSERLDQFFQAVRDVCAAKDEPSPEHKDQDKVRRELIELQHKLDAALELQESQMQCLAESIRRALDAELAKVDAQAVNVARRLKNSERGLNPFQALLPLQKEIPGIPEAPPFGGDSYYAQIHAAAVGCVPEQFAIHMPTYRELVTDKHTPRADLVRLLQFYNHWGGLSDSPSDAQLCDTLAQYLGCPL